MKNARLYWTCDCGIIERAQADYELGDSEPCIYCADGTARVVTAADLDEITAREKDLRTDQK